jgi:hypothetical protein
MITQAAVETSETAGIYNIKFPALPDGNYTVRAKLTYSGETDTAVFSGIEVKPQTASATETGGMSWAHTFLIGLIFLIVLALFGALIYFVLHLSVIKEETVSA